MTSLPLSIPKFIAWRSHRHFKQDMPLKDIPTFVYTSYTGPRFATDARGRVWGGATVTNLALQLAYHMGIEKAILIGVDHNFASKGDANKTVVSEGDDHNHFMPNYFGKGVKWQLPDLDTSEIGYTFAREAYRKAGREVVDATVGGKLTIFPKVDYNSLFFESGFDSDFSQYMKKSILFWLFRWFLILTLVVGMLLALVYFLSFETAVSLLNKLAPDGSFLPSLLNVFRCFTNYQV